MRAILAATSEGLYVVGAKASDDYPDISDGVQELFNGPVSALAVHARNSTLQAFALTDTWEELQFNHFHLGSLRATSPVPPFAPTCMIDIGTSSWSRAAGTVGAHLFGVFERTDAEWEQWDADHNGENSVPYDRVPAFDAIPERDTWTQPWGAPADLRSLAVLRGESVAVLANAHVGGVVRSDDDGATWAQLVDPGIDVHQVATLPPAVIAIATGARGCGLSRDGGASWTFSTAGLHGSYCRAIAIVDEVLLLSASTGPRSTDGRIYRASVHDPALVFEPVTDGLPARFEGNIDSHHVAARYRGPDCALVAPEGTVYVSHDASQSWRPVGQVPGAVRQIAVT